MKELSEYIDEWIHERPDAITMRTFKDLAIEKECELVGKTSGIECLYKPELETVPLNEESCRGTARGGAVH